MSKPRVIYWFRTDLRLHDSPALHAALALAPEALYPVWTWDPHYAYRARVGPNRFQFLLDCQRDLSASLARLNPRQKLLVLREAPQTLFPRLLREWRISHLVFEKDTDAYARERDDAVCEIAREAGVEVLMRSGRTLWDADELVAKNGGRPTMSITQTQEAGKKVGKIPRPLPPPEHLPDPGDTRVGFEQRRPGAGPDFNKGARAEPDHTYDALAGPGGDFGVPTLEELGMPAGAATTPHRGGETRALESLAETCADERYTATFEKPRTAPTAFAPQSTTLLSPHLHFGSLSVREFYWRVQDVVAGFKGAASTPPASLTGQLFFRDMYFGAQAAVGAKYGQTLGNPVIRFVPWHLPSKTDAGTGLVTGRYDVDSEEAEVWFQRWKYGRTGFPWIDALMRQLRAEGWIHHLGRHSVACFLTRGGCYVDWERGAELFEEWLLDHEVACNAGNWMWLSCTAFYSQFYRCYSPVAFPQKTDKDGDFVRRYVPELAKFSKKFIYEPWKAPIKDQKDAGCLIRGDGGAAEGKLNEELEEEEGKKVYPKPMFDFAKRRDVCIQGMKKAYAVGLKGADKKVFDGTWRKEYADSDEGPTEGNSGLAGAMIQEDDGSGEVNGSEHEVDNPDAHTEKPSPQAGAKHKRQDSRNPKGSKKSKK